MAHARERWSRLPEKAGGEERVVSMATHDAAGATGAQGQADTADTAGTDFVLFDLRALTRFDLLQPRVVTLAETGTSRLLLVAMRRGQALPPQAAPSEASIQALRGRLRLSVGAGSAELVMGQLAQVEAGATFALRALSDAVALVSLSPSPGEAALSPALRGAAAPLVTRAPDAAEDAG